MISKTDQKEIRDVPSQIIEQFLAKLRESGISPDVVNRLAEAVTEQEKPTQRAIATALFPDDKSP